MRREPKTILYLFILVFFLMPADRLAAQSAEPPRRYRVEGGILREQGARRDTSYLTQKSAQDNHIPLNADSLTLATVLTDSTLIESLSDSLLLTDGSPDADITGSTIADSDNTSLSEYADIQLKDSLVYHSSESGLHGLDSVSIAAGYHITQSDSLNLGHEDNPEIAFITDTETVIVDSLPLDNRDLAAIDSALMEPSRRMQKRFARLERKNDPYLRHHWLFDSIPISPLTAISIGVPGFAQFYNKQYWKIPVLYGVTGVSVWQAVREGKRYRPLKQEYEYMKERGATQARLDIVQEPMIRHNTRKQLWMAAAFGSYMYFLGDGVINYAGEATNVKKATTLSMIMPGAGQFYNQSYWKAPIVLGGFATFIFMIDWNNRGYQRFKLAYDQDTNPDPNIKSEFTRNKGYNLTPDQLRSYRDSYRRNRDLCIILAGAWYLLNVIEAHSDAHMKDYDVSDNLNINIVPSINTFNTQRTGTVNSMGLTFSITF